jgi:hypothetical protein
MPEGVMMGSSVATWTLGVSLATLLPSLVTAETITIATGASAAVDGYLSVGLDAYGSWSATDYGGAGDLFNPLGGGPSGAAEPVAFTSGLFIFYGSSKRELLSENALWQEWVGDDDSFHAIIRDDLAASDRNDDGVPDRLTSSFDLNGGGLNVRVDLIQEVTAIANGVSALRQEYTISNYEPEPTPLKLVRSFDGDLSWSGGFDNDEVGTSMHGAGLGTYVFLQEETYPGVTAVTLSSPQATSYYGGKQGFEPPLGGPPFGFGTDALIWDTYGIPGTWVNLIAGVGYDTNGLSGIEPVADAFVGLGFNIELEGFVGATASVTIWHSFGQASPASLCLADLDDSGAVDIGDLLLVLANWGTPDGDVTGDGTTDVADLLALLGAWGSCE